MPHYRKRPAGVRSREQLEREFGPTYDVKSFARAFILVGIDGGNVVVRRKSDGAAFGTLRYQSDPTFFYDFQSLHGYRGEA